MNLKQIADIVSIIERAKSYKNDSDECYESAEEIVNDLAEINLDVD